jgi:bifunctional N-acetylglucosamine-1-phosphate-uridyltransferase/glucosamine-1-phosphate-acetyltransferase GlmU-like protein
MPANGYRPIIRPKNLRTTVPKKNFRKAVREVREMEKNDPVGYAAMLKKYENTVVRIVPG